MRTSCGIDFAVGLRKSICNACVVLLAAVGSIQALAQPTPPRERPQPIVGLLVVGGSVSCDSGALGYGAACMVEGLHALGYTEGRNIAFEYRYARGDSGKLPALAAELVALHPDVIFTSTNPGADAAAKATSTIPIVVGPAGEEMMTHLVGNLGRPSGNVTGLILSGRALDQKVLQLLQETVPRMARVAVIQIPASADSMRSLGHAARELRVTLVPFEAQNGAALPQALAAVAASGADALFMFDEPVLLGTNDVRKRVAEWALGHRMPVASSNAEFAAAGGLLSLGPDVRQAARRAAYYVQRLLDGARPSDLPVEAPTIFRLTINRRTATALNITVPNGVLVRADQVID